MRTPRQRCAAALLGRAGRTPRVTIDHRPIDQSDYERAYATIHALYLHATGEGEERAVWEILRDLHEGYLGGRIVPLDDLIGDSAANREAHHAMILLESLIRGDGTMPNRSIRSINSVCATPGCPHLTEWAYCLSCELERRDRQADS
jgi:hypothetical protein